jgi:hypothetical protein
LLSSKGIFHAIEKTVTVKLGGIIAFSPDTAYYLETGAPLQGAVWGKGHIGAMDSAGTIRQKDLQALIERLTDELTAKSDTMVQNLPLTIQHNDEFEKIPDFVKGPLFIDGSRFDLVWKQKRRVTVLGDVQLTGKVDIEGVELVASGEIKCFDDCHCHDIMLLSLQRIIMADRAVFFGTAIAKTNMLLYGHAAVEKRSTLVALGEEGRATQSAPSSTTPPTTHGTIPKKVFSITFAESSTIDATVVALKNDLGIKIDKNVVVKGVIWTKGYVSLAGTLYGVVYAKALIDAAKALAGQLSPDPILPGTASIRRIEDIDKYYFPFFMGKLTVIQWQE